MKLIILFTVLLLWLNCNQAFRYPLPNNFYNYRHRNHPKPENVQEIEKEVPHILEKPLPPLPPEKVQLILEMIASRLEEIKNLPLMLVNQKKSEESGAEKLSMRLNRMM